MKRATRGPSAKGTGRVIGLKLDKTTTAFIGYAYVRTDPAGPAKSHEHRIFQQLSFRIAGDGKGVTLTGRTRLEKRMFESQDGTGWRLRQQLRLTPPQRAPI